MEESPEEERKREEMLRMYHACKEALSIIGDVSMQTSYQPAPPPIKDDWQFRNMAPSPTPMASKPLPPSNASNNRPMPPPASNPSRGAPPPPGRPAPNVPGRGAAPPPIRPGGLPPPLIPT